ncbi:MAG: alpha/beta fold hydrolase [Gammaproteobacteria bacterium]|nr:alpha/beta fold hydrolase [Gammaproteobacteria bacterium]MCB1863227.1 alpha/beta fold hydrolase [Gammaproteobacteria bacterium]
MFCVQLAIECGRRGGECLDQQIGSGGAVRYTGWIVVLMLLVGSSSASDLARERRIALELEDAILIGSPLRLSANGSEFFAIHAESAAAQLLGGVILLHGSGANPNWHDVVFPLRAQLPESGWETLSIQLPIAAADVPEGSDQALIPEAFPRILAALEFFRQRGVENVALVGHSLGAQMGLEYLANDPTQGVKALVAVGLSARRDIPVTGTLLALQKVKLPILDIYGSRDIEPVLATVNARAIEARRADNPDYRQLEVPGADHFFTGLDDQLVQRVHAWLQKTVSSRM